MKKGTKTILLTAALTLGLAAPAAADVAVTLPDFPVTLNGTAIDNSYRQYPLLVYKNITYFLPCEVSIYTQAGSQEIVYVCMR